MVFERKDYLSKVKIVVIKIGSSLLTDSKLRKTNVRFLRNLARQIHDLKNRNIQCVIVTSGAIAAGMFELQFSKRPKEMSKLQALAAVGQSNLMHAYETTFKQYGLKVAQILLTREDLSNRGRYSNAQNTFLELFNHKIIPVVNENDSVAVEEIKFGDNDTLGVLVSYLTNADLFVILTDTDGFFNDDPRLNPNAELIYDVFKMDGQLEKKACRSNSIVGTGGMRTKIQAAKSMMQSGVPMIIANGNSKSVIARLILKKEKMGTLFHPSIKKMNSRKRWLAWSIKPTGEVIVDEGAKKALEDRKKSLLPIGVKGVIGTWGKGEIVKIMALDGREIARGMSNYTSQDIEKIKGLKTSEISQKYGTELANEVVHRDNMVKINDAS